VQTLFRQQRIHFSWYIPGGFGWYRLGRLLTLCSVEYRGVPKSERIDGCNGLSALIENVCENVAEGIDGCSDSISCIEYSSGMKTQ
jgi:hypothetical protein